MNRRNFISKTLISAAVGLGGSPALRALEEGGDQEGRKGGGNNPHPQLTDAREMRGEMLYRKLGRTGESVSAIGLSGSHIGKASVTEAAGIRLIQEAIDRGLTFMDNSWDYNEGESEIRMGKALAESGYRDKSFVVTKIDGRGKDIATRQIETSLMRLKTDRIGSSKIHAEVEDPVVLVLRVSVANGKLVAYSQGPR